MKKNIYKILIPLFVCLFFFSFGNKVLAQEACTKNTDCTNPSLMECKIEAPRTQGICILKNNALPINNPIRACKWKVHSSLLTETCKGEEQGKATECEGEVPMGSSGSYYLCCCKKIETPAEKTADLNPLGNLQVKIPGLDKLAEKYPATCITNSDGKTECQIPWIAIYIKAIYNYFVMIGGLLAVIALMIGGVVWLVSAGNTSRISEAQSWIMGSVTGIVIILSSYVLLYQINPKLIELKFLNLESIEKLELETELTAPIEYNGNLMYPPSTWVSLPTNSNIINNGKTNPELAKAIIKAAECMKKYGYKIKITSLSRTVTKQAEIYDKNYSHEPNKCGTKKENVNEACCPYPLETKLCPHTSGQAVDMWGWDPAATNSDKKSKNAQYKLQECMFATGACLLETECWHFELPKLSPICTQTKNLNGNSCNIIRNEP